MIPRLALALAFLVLLACTDVMAGQGRAYLLAPREFSLYLGTRFPVRACINSYPGSTRPVTLLHTAQGEFARSGSTALAVGHDMETLCLEKLPAHFTGDIHLWVTMDGVEVTRVTVPVRRPRFMAAVPLDGGRVRYTLHDQHGQPIAGAPALLRLRVDNRIPYAAAGVTDARGHAEFALPLDRFTGAARAEIHSYGVPAVSLAVAGTGTQNLPFPAQVGAFAAPERVDANQCAQFPVIVTATNPDGAPLPARAQCNFYGSQPLALQDGLGIASLPAGLFDFKSIPLQALLFTDGGGVSAIGETRTIPVIMHEPQEMVVAQHLDLTTPAQPRLAITMKDTRGNLFAGVPAAVSFGGNPYQVVHTDDAGRCSVPIPRDPYMTGYDADSGAYAYTVHLDTYAYHHFFFLLYDRTKRRLTGIADPVRKGHDVVHEIVETVSYDRKGRPTVNRSHE